MGGPELLDRFPQKYEWKELENTNALGIVTGSNLGEHSSDISGE